MRGIHGINLQTSVLYNVKVCSTHDGGGRVRKGAWTREEDILLKKCIEKNGEGKWQLVPSRAGLNRCRKSCRLRWMNYLKPDIKRGEFMADEVDLILRLHRLLGNRWALIAGRIPGRTANDVKNYWNTYLRKKVVFSHKKNSTKNSNDNNNSNNIAKHNIIKPRPWTFKKQKPALMNNGSTITIDTNIQTTENGCNNIHSEPAVVSPPVLEESSNKYYWWESLLDDCIFNEGITNSFVSSSPGLADHGQLNKNNNNNNIANCLSDEVEPAVRTLLPNCNDITDGGTTNSHGVLVEDQGQQTCWTDFIMDMDLWNNISPMQTKGIMQ